jgi:hypothetical protein
VYVNSDCEKMHGDYRIKYEDDEFVALAVK